MRIQANYVYVVDALCSSDSGRPVCLVSTKIFALRFVLQEVRHELQYHLLPNIFECQRRSALAVKSMCFPGRTAPISEGALVDYIPVRMQKLDAIRSHSSLATSVKRDSTKPVT